jgi:hypothetical protein
VHGARAAAIRVGANGNLDDLPCRVLEETVDVRGWPHVAAADGEQVFARANIDAGLSERRTQLRVPVEAAVDFLEAIPPVLDRVVGAEKTTWHGFRGVQAVTAAASVMADRQLARHPLNHAVEVATDGDVG